MYESITKKLFSVQTVAVFMHINPDGDCVGSSLALYHYLTSLGKDVYVFSENKSDIRENLNILPQRGPLTISMAFAFCVMRSPRLEHYSTYE